MHGARRCRLLARGRSPQSVGGRQPAAGRSGAPWKTPATILHMTADGTLGDPRSQPSQRPCAQESAASRDLAARQTLPQCTLARGKPELDPARPRRPPRGAAAEVAPALCRIRPQAWPSRGYRARPRGVRALLDSRDPTERHREKADMVPTPEAAKEMRREYSASAGGKKTRDHRFPLDKLSAHRPSMYISACNPTELLPATLKVQVRRDKHRAPDVPSEPRHKKDGRGRSWRQPGW
ncbi:hypothetical protein NDU88_001149 [Pleurodeles waltl]|uniref:Uncharacterized protein n=1 Tax=Pleurodeles waltl TaxID=8319 RepID=A0AAV7KNQ3_PLEWA|nr:hypothetical protein NDU88_001149 [Pleurodeles waltl]